ncbi:uncharacterized protein TRIREDRAFT_106647 [Trichoderma reesei QM6a]|uniref:Predicted protein n=2 Tax=Hypocrea jecorina TaxID=51453 RepID=G0RGZ2_HYPJQ|nr:uncharacterized protein TRIREDRAFT_106647 [Trichoderma reesei QM6a]EGR49654.1 predicted protein [Trichoderma reesei QM6a]ETS02761.1 hypothetical protein M419DRAFT_34487 [Trichoderma reesei RUT C-30]
MSLPSFVLTPAGSSEAQQPALKARKLTHGWAVPTSIAADDPEPSHAEEQSSTIQDAFLPLQAAEFPMLQQSNPGSCIEPRMMDIAATAEEFLFPVTSRGEAASLDPWLNVPDCQSEPSIFQPVPTQQVFDVFQPLWSSGEVAFEPPDLENFSAVPYPEGAPISGSLETLKQSIGQFQLPSDAIPPAEGIPQLTIGPQNQAESKAKNGIARGQIIDQVLDTLRQMDNNIRASNRLHMADIASLD